MRRCERVSKPDNQAGGNDEVSVSRKWSKSTNYLRKVKLTAWDGESSEPDRDVGKFFPPGIVDGRFPVFWSGHGDYDRELNLARDFCRRACRLISRMIVFNGVSRGRVGEQASQERG